jgi:hypothetical protein
VRPYVEYGNEVLKGRERCDSSDLIETQNISLYFATKIEQKRRTTKEEPVVNQEQNRSPQMPPDRLNDIGVLKRREIEARIVGPLLEALGNEFGRERVLAVARDTVVKIAHEQGAQLAKAVGGDSLAHLAGSLDLWKKDDALQMDVLEQTEQTLSFNITRCRYAELYRALGIPELGALLSCNRDFAMSEGFNPDISLTRTQTIMQGAPFCDFRFALKPKAGASSDR